MQRLKSHQLMTSKHQKSQDSKKDLGLIDAKPWWEMIKKGARQMLALTQTNELLVMLERAERLKSRNAMQEIIQEAICKTEALKRDIQKIK